MEELPTLFNLYYYTDRILYYLFKSMVTVLQNDAPFGIDENTGVVRLTSALDFTVQDSYMLTITAQVH